MKYVPFIPQDSSTIFFLHCSSYEALKLPQLANDSVPTVTSCVGKVEHKEYCVARKDENRYKVPKGTNFYRVKVRPRSPGREGRGKGEGDGNVILKLVLILACDISLQAT